MAERTSLTLYRNSDVRITYSLPDGYNLTGYAPVFYFRTAEGEAPVLTVSGSATANGSLALIEGGGVVLTIKADDAALFPGGDISTGVYDSTLTKDNFVNRFVGGPVTVYVDGSYGKGLFQDAVIIDLGGQDISVIIEGGNLAVGASVALSELNDAVAEAAASAEAAGTSAAQAASAVAGVPTMIASKVSLVDLAASGGSALVGYTNGGTGAVLRTAQSKLRDILSVKDFGAVGDGTTNDSAAFNAAVASLPASGGEIHVPDATGYKLLTKIETGTKKVVWRIGQTTIICPPGDHGLVLQSNGSGVIGAGKWSTIFQLTAPTVPMVVPTITTTLTANAVTGASIGGGGSGMKSCPVAVVANSPAAAVVSNPDAGLILTQAGGTISNVAIVAAGSGYVTPPTVTVLGGGAAAVMIDNVQACTVRGFSVDFQNVPGSVGVYHRGGWWVHVEDVDVIYNVATGVMSESSTSLGLVIDSYTAGVPGPTGAYGGSYVSQYTNIHFTKRAMVGHDTSTVTTMNFNRCDFKNSYLHACIDIVDAGPVAQADTGYFYDLINVDSLTILGGDFESTAGWFRLIGSCNNVRILNTLTIAASGARFRGQPGTGSDIDPAESDSVLASVRFGSGGSAGRYYQNVGFLNQGGSGYQWDGNTFTLGSNNLKMIGTTQGNLDDVSKNGQAVVIDTSGQLIVYQASAGANPRTIGQALRVDGAGVTTWGVYAGDAFYQGGTKVVGARGAAVADATDAASVITQLNALLARLRAHGLIAT